jgi:Ni/Co efflux regulator RcnB
MGDVLIAILKFLKRRKGNTGFVNVVSVISNRSTIALTIPSFKEIFMPRPSRALTPFARTLALLVVGAALVSVVHAAKPEWAGQGKNKRGEQEHRQEQGTSVEVRVGDYFGDDQRHAAQDYYGKQKAKGHCPPGLAKKNNGCMPPGQAKKWTKGQPLPKDVVFYPVPNQVIVKIGLPPKGYKYVRVANDILMIAIGSSMVVDAIEDLMR